MRYLVDTNVLLRRLQPAHAHSRLARQAIIEISLRGNNLIVVPQVLIELWAACTRPVAQNGLGLSPFLTQQIVSELEAEFMIERDIASIYDEWRNLVETHAVSGRQIHDARLVAAMRVHGIGGILTFNAADFRRYAPLHVLDPHDLAA